MRTPLCKRLGGAALVVAACFLAGASGSAGDGKADIWKPVMPAGAFDRLVSQQTMAIVQALASKNADGHLRAQVDAIRVAAIALSVQGGEADLHHGALVTSLQVAKMIKKNKDLAEASKLAASLPFGRDTTRAKAPDLSKYLEVADLMNVYRTKKKGGEGIAPALQSTGPLKQQNGIEEKIRYLARKKMAPAKLAKESEALALLGYELAADGSLTATFAAAQKKDPARWREYSLAVRDAAVQLATAARKADAAAVFKAATTLDNACNQCHTVYRQSK
jgi:hypothetical protein